MEPVVVVSFVALWGLVVFQGLVLLGLVRAVAELSATGRRGVAAGAQHPAGLGVAPPPPTPGELTGQPAPRFSALDVLGERVESTRFDGQARLLVFVAPGCPACQELQAELEVLGCERHATIVLVCVARAQPCRQFAEQHEITRPLLVDGEALLANTFGISVTPTAVYIDAQNVVGQYQHLGRQDDPSQVLQQLAAQLASPPHP